jgi:Flp pilus assembly protein TadD
LASRSHGIPASVVDLSTVAAWCPGCFDDSSATKSVPASTAATGAQLKPIVAELDTYLALLDQAYRSGGAATPAAADGSRRQILGSAYLGALVPDTAAVHSLLGMVFLREGRFGEAAAAFREALKRQPDSPEANSRLGMTLVQIGRTAEAIPFLRRAVEIEPNNANAQYQLGSLLLENRAFAEAAEHFKAALRVKPDSASAHNDLGIALARMGQMDQAIDHFKRAVALDPQFAEGRRNLESAMRLQRQAHS